MTNIIEKAKFYRALSNETRLNIVDYLLKNKCKCICHIAEHVKKDQSTVFRHIEILKEADLIGTKKEDKFLWCCIKDKEKVIKLLEV